MPDSTAAARSLIALAWLCFAGQGAAASAAETPADSQPDAATIEAVMPGTTVHAIAPTAVPGLFEVVDQNGQIFYVDATGRIGLFGNLVDLAARRSITTDRLGEVRRVEFAALPLELSIKRVHGDGSRRLALFSDPDCPFCQQIEHTLAGITDVTIYLFPYPLEELHPGATRRSQQIWCSADRALAWEAWVLRAEAPTADGGCENPIAQIQALARKFLIQSTPGLIFESGRNIPGAASSADIERWLEEPAPAQSAGGD